MRATNEWDTLTKVIVGIADNAKIPEVDISLRTVNYANVGTNKPVFTYKKMPSGWSEKNTIYSFSDSSTMKVQKTAIYGCPQRIE